MEDALRARIAAEGPLSFATFMEWALYHEDFGYYSDPARHRIGAGGDFVTNVSVGETFGRLLALRFHQLWIDHGSPPAFQLYELGPEDGSLAIDILKWVRTLSPQFHGAVRYFACEASARKRAALDDRFQAAREPALCPLDPAAAPLPGFGAVFANEVLDALPVHLLRWREGRWFERRVGLCGEALAWVEAPVQDPLLLERATALGAVAALPDGYQTEVCLSLDRAMRDFAALIERGLLVFIDYGFTADDYYHPHRTEGTLRTYAGQQAGDDPLDSPGSRDLTAHVDFTAAMEAGRRAGLAPLGFARQESYLTNLAAPLLRSLPPGPESISFIRQFRTLTHPGFFGSRFHVLELSKGDLAPAFAFPCASSEFS